MAKYTFEVTIDAATERDAELKLKSATVLMQKLNLVEISKPLQRKLWEFNL
jgi:hypothetical protein